MSSQRPLDDEAARAATFSDVYFRLGWSRQFPPAAIDIILPLVAHGPSTPDEIEERFRTLEAAKNGWASAAWEPVHEYTDAEIIELHEQIAETPWAAAEDEPVTGAGATEEEAAHQARFRTQVDSYCRALGLPEVRTLADLLEYMVACGVINRRRAGDRVLLELNPHAPLPTEILPMPEAERIDEDEKRWTRMHEDTAQEIILLFDPTGARVDVLTTSLGRLARQLEVDVETARAAVANLVEHDDFTTSVEVARAADHQVFELRVDWERFNATRFQVKIVRPDDK